MRRLLLTAVSVALVAGATACSSGRDALTIYSGRDEALIGPLLDRFSKEHDLPIDVRYGDSAELALLIEQEGDGSPADVFISQSPGAVGYLAAQDLLSELPEELLGKVASEWEQEGGHWVGLTARQRVLVYNDDLVSQDELPTSVLDLTDDRFRGRVAVAPNNGSFQDFVTSMRQIEGEDVTRSWLEDMAENDAQTYPDNNSIVDAVARGEVAMGLANHYYNYRYLAEDPDAKSRNHLFSGQDVGSILLATSAAVIAGSEHEEDAVRFLGLLLSEEAQSFFAEETFEYPLAAGVPPSVDLPPLSDLAHPNSDLGALGGELRATVDMIRESGLL